MYLDALVMMTMALFIDIEDDVIGEIINDGDVTVYQCSVGNVCL